MELEEALAKIEELKQEAKANSKRVAELEKVEAKYSAITANTTDEELAALEETGVKGFVEAKEGALKSEYEQAHAELTEKLEQANTKLTATQKNKLIEESLAGLGFASDNAKNVFAGMLDSSYSLNEEGALTGETEVSAFIDNAKTEHDYLFAKEISGSGQGHVDNGGDATQNTYTRKDWEQALNSENEEELVKEYLAGNITITD